MTVLPKSESGLWRECPRCSAQPGEPCRFRFGGERKTTHEERKDKA